MKTQDKNFILKLIFELQEFQNEYKIIGNEQDLKAIENCLNVLYFQLKSLTMCDYMCGGKDE